MGDLSPEIAAVYETFAATSFGTHWAQLALGRAHVELGSGLRLAIDQAAEGQPALAQLDDGLTRPRGQCLWSPPLIMQTRARFSHSGGAFLGTAGFGFWNNPTPLWATRLEARPNWIWFYYASPQSTLSLMPGPPNGFKAAVVYGGRRHGLTANLCEALLKVPAAGRLPAGRRVPAFEMTLDPDLMAHWHTYRIAWLPNRISFQVDERFVLDTCHVPRGPLAFVSWVDNNVASLGPTGEIRPGHLPIGRPQWLELEYLSIVRG